MVPRVVLRSDAYISNRCARILARENQDPRHDFGQYLTGDSRARYCDAWQLPLIDTFAADGDFVSGHRHDAVTFVYVHPDAAPPSSVGLIGSFSDLHTATPLRPVAETPWWTVTVVVPKGEVHTYVFLVDGQVVVDPINPQQVVLENGRTWSRFFTTYCGVPLTLEEEDRDLLVQLARYLLPFEASDVRAALDRHYDRLDQRPRSLDYLHVYGPEPSLGAVNYIDKILAREERHHLVDYRLCLPILRRLLAERHPGAPLMSVPGSTFTALFGQMASNRVPGWPHAVYGEPRYFFTLLHRHVVTGAFAHPKYGGNAGCGGWVFLEERYRASDPPHRTLFDWRRSIEPPLGNSEDYHGILATLEAAREEAPHGN